MDTSTVCESYTRNSGDPYTAGRELCLTPTAVMDVIRSVEHRPIDGLAFIVPTRPRPRQVGRPQLARNIISIRHRDECGWPVQDRAAIELARKAYDAGMSELAQGRDGPWVIQYAFRRRRRDVKREIWFSRTNGTAA